MQGDNGFAATASLKRQGNDASSTLYETAKVLSNREAAAECASKAQDALTEADFDKAVRLNIDPAPQHEAPLPTCTCLAKLKAQNAL